MVIMSEWKECDHIKPINVYDIAIKIAMAKYARHFLLYAFQTLGI